MATAELTIDTGVGVYVKIVSIAIRAPSASDGVK
jgi:hypothetical protein